jgi:EAL and modified HD-GYP domain-containing signal transduction protein
VSSQSTYQTGASEIFVARQPILDQQQNLYAYELLYRSSRENAFDGTDSTTATSRVISNSYLTLGLERLVGDRRAFINFDRAMLTGGMAEMLPSANLVVELLEEITPDDEVLASCRSLKSKGYLLALDDFVCADGFESILQLADIVKVDFRLTTEQQRRPLTRRLLGWGVRLLAEKVETKAEFDSAARLGYTLFQGYFFSRPDIVEGRQIPGFKLNYLRILSEAGNPALDFDRIENVLKSEASLLHKLLRYVNSAQFRWTREVESIRHALALLGERELRRWIALVTMSGLAEDKPQQLVVDAVTRGRFCEKFSARVGLASRSSEMFLLGLYSLLDALLDRPLAEVVAEVHLADDIAAALLGEPVKTRGLAETLCLACAYEKADWALIEATTRKLNASTDAVATTYLEAVEWADTSFNS